MKTLTLLVSTLGIFLFSACSLTGPQLPEDINCTKLAGKYTTYLEFKKCTTVKSYNIYKNKDLLNEATSKNTKVNIDISEQRAKLYVNNKIALDAPCTTGAKHKFEPNTKIYRDKRTPLGTFKITEKIRDKRSTIFGKYYKGKRCVYTGDKRKYKGSKKGVQYKGASLGNWMRLTSSGIGLHASKYVKRYPGTNGCIRLPYHVSKTIFNHVRKGTPVTVSN
jgi:lipoprotein-anchoring transpeptidase ErfK/SrfK